VCGEKCMTDGVVREWYRKFKDSLTDMHNKGDQGRKSVATDDLFQRVDEVVRDNRRFNISALSMEFPEVSRPLYFIVDEHSGYKKHKNSLATTFYKEGIGKFVKRFYKCLSCQGRKKCT